MERGSQKEDQKRIFERFVQLQNKEKLDIRGTGLGLSICRGLIEQHHGTLNIESPPKTGQKGSIFWFSIPAVDKTARKTIGSQKGGSAPR